MAETELNSYPAKVLDTINEGVVVIGADGRYAFTNEAAKSILGTEETVVGRHHDDSLWKLTTSDGRPVPVDEMPLAIVMRTGEPVLDAEYCATLPDGRKVDLAINARPFRDEEQRLLGVAMSFGDITKRSRSEKYGWALSEMSTAVYSSPDFDTIVQRALDRGVDALGCDAGVIFMREGGGALRHRDGAPHRRARAHAARTRCQLRAREGRRVGVGEVNVDPRAPAMARCSSCRRSWTLNPQFR